MSIVKLSCKVCVFSGSDAALPLCERQGLHKGSVVVYSNRQAWFIFKSAVLLFVINFCCGIVIPILVSAVNNVVADNSIQETLASQSLQSFLTWLATAAFMCWILWDDGRKNTAYGCFDSFSLIMCFALMFLVYFFPAFFTDNASQNVEIFLQRQFKSCQWIGSEKSATSVLAAGVLYLIPCIACYLGGHLYYCRKHSEGRKD